MTEPIFRRLLEDTRHRHDFHPAPPLITPHGRQTTTLECACGTRWHPASRVTTTTDPLPGYADTSAPSLPKEPPVSLATLESDIRNDVQAVADKLSEGYDHVKRILEQHLPQLAALQASPVAQAIEGAILPPDVEAELTQIVQTFVKRFSQAAADSPGDGPADVDAAAAGSGLQPPVPAV